MEHLEIMQITKIRDDDLYYCNTVCNAYRTSGRHTVDRYKTLQFRQ
jgi:hypothetical protein